MEKEQNVKITLTKADLMKGQALQPGWYKADVIAFKVKPPKSGGESLNYVPTFKIPSLDGFELDHTFNSQAIGNMGPFIAALRNTNVKAIMELIKGGTLEFETDEAIGKKLQIKIKNEEFQGRLVNKVDGFLPYDAVVPF